MIQDSLLKEITEKSPSIRITVNSNRALNEFHLFGNEMDMLSGWKPVDIDYMNPYEKFQRIIHDYIDGIEAITALKKEIFTKHN